MARRQPDHVYTRRRLGALVVVLAVLGAPVLLLSRSGGDPGSAPPDAPRVEDAGATADGTPPACRAAVDALDTRSRLALLVMVGVDGDDVDRIAELLAAADRPGGVFVHSGSAVWDEGLFAEADRTRPLLVAVDDEGGRVQPLAGVLDDLPSAATQASLGATALVDAGEARGRELRALGVDVVFAPVVDVGGGAGIGDRSYGDDAATVTALAGAYAEGLRAAGVLPVLKHFPGHGSASADSHDGRASTRPVAELRAADLKPYEALLEPTGIGVMVGHLDVPGLTELEVPASLSPDAIGLLRAAYEFDGLVVTDDLSAMRAVTDRYPVPVAAELALSAGADVALLARQTDVGAVLDRLADAATTGRLSERRIGGALDRVVAASGCDPAAG